MHEWQMMRLRILLGIMRLAAKFNWTETELQLAMDLVDYD